MLYNYGHAKTHNLWFLLCLGNLVQKPGYLHNYIIMVNNGDVDIPEGSKELPPRIILNDLELNKFNMIDVI